jgi:hypothetical protein
MSGRLTELPTMCTFSASSSLILLLLLPFFWEAEEEEEEGGVDERWRFCHFREII